MPVDSCRGILEGCECGVCLVTIRIANLCRFSQSESFKKLALGRLRDLQGELLDLSFKPEHRDRGAPREEAPGEGAGAVSSGTTKEKEDRRSPTSAKRSKEKKLPAEKERRSRSRRKEHKKRRSAAGSSRKSHPREKPEEKEDTRADSKKKSARERSPSYSRKKDPRGSPSGSDKREGRIISPKSEPSAREENKGAVEEVEPPSPTLAASAKSKPAAARASSSSSRRRRSLSRRVASPPRGGRAAPKSPPGPPPGRRWSGPIRGWGPQDPPRWGKNRGLGKFHRNHQVRTLGWETFHATQGRPSQARR